MILTSITQTRSYVDRADIKLRIIVTVVVQLSSQMDSRPAFGDIYVFAVPHVYFTTKVKNQRLKI